MENGQLLERFRLLSREIQNGLQNSQKLIESLKKNQNIEEISRISSTIDKINEAWQDFSGWILVSTIDNLEEARANCAPGRVDIPSKIVRSKNRRKSDLARMGIKIDTSDVETIVVETFIPYFEQLLDLLFSNAIKYSPKAGDIEVVCNRAQHGATISIKSVGPLCQKSEINQLGEKGFRSENAQGTNLSGQGYGLYNCKRLCELLGIKIEFRPEQRALYTANGVTYGNFQVLLRVPNAPPQTYE